MKKTAKMTNPSERTNGKKETIDTATLSVDFEIRNIERINRNANKYSVNPEKIKLKYKGEKNRKNNG